MGIPLGEYLVKEEICAKEQVDEALNRLELLRESPFFSSLPEEYQDLLADLGELALTKTLPSNTPVFQKGAPGDAFYIITAYKLAFIYNFLKGGSHDGYWNCL